MHLSAIAFMQCWAMLFCVLFRRCSAPFFLFNLSNTITKGNCLLSFILSDGWFSSKQIQNPLLKVHWSFLSFTNFPQLEMAFLENHVRCQKCQNPFFQFRVFVRATFFFFLLNTIFQKKSEAFSAVFRLQFFLSQYCPTFSIKEVGLKISDKFSNYQ